MMEKTNKYKNKRQKFIFILIGAFVGVALLVFGGTDNKDKTDVQETVRDDYAMTEEYARMLEERVAEICSEVKGVNDVQVFVSLSGGYKTVYAYDSQSTSSGHKSQLVMSGSGSDKKAVVSAYEYPQISGVGIVYQGADDAAVRAQMISLVSASLDISTNKIFVAVG